MFDLPEYTLYTFKDDNEFSNFLISHMLQTVDNLF